MDAAFTNPVLLSRSLAVLLLIALAAPLPAHAQAWADAYRSGDFQKAANLLHPVIAALDFEMAAEPEPYQHLATLYANGLGVVRDPIAACALAMTARFAAERTQQRFDWDLARFEAFAKPFREFERSLCDALAGADRQIATNLMGGCYAMGMREEAVPVGPHTVKVGHLGMAVADGFGSKTRLTNCVFAVGGVRTRSVDPPPDAAPGVEARHLVEIFVWYAGRHPNGEIAFRLMWEVHEPRPEGMVVTGAEELAAARSWPPSRFAPEIEFAPKMEMIRSGHIRWQIDGTPPRRGWIMLPDKERR